MSAVGVVAIGRNEGERLCRCLDALVGVGATVVYVDSDSTDGSTAHAQARGVEVVALDMSKPFTAARARNAGFERLLQVDPGVRFVQFLDGDCEIATGWLELGCRSLEDRPDAAVVFGRRSERFPERSIYNRLADIEWNVPDAEETDDGATRTCGGDAMIRVEAFRAVGGYDPSVPAGEEPELCQRLRHAGWLIVRLDAAMTWHDSAMFRFGEWARRQVRTGYGGLDFATRFVQGDDPSLSRRIRSARLWTLGWPLAVIIGGLLVAKLDGPVAGGLAAGLLAVALPTQVVRVAARTRSRAVGARAALAYGVLTMLGKWFQMYGQLLYLRDRIVGRHARLIEYKFAGSPPQQSAPLS
jgi:GT2 family glycosyltransferase